MTQSDPSDTHAAPEKGGEDGRLPLYSGSLTDVAGLELGHAQDERRPTGCTVVIARQGAVAGVDVRGAAPGTRETDLLEPGNLVQQIHALVLSGGSAWGLGTAQGVMHWLEEQGIGLQTGHGLVPIVPGAVIFDLGVGDASVRPEADHGRRACMAASSQAWQQGSVGAGTGALVGKLRGQTLAMRGGLGMASLRAAGHTVAALVVCNAVGDIRDPETGRWVAGARTMDGRSMAPVYEDLIGGQSPQRPAIDAGPGRNTTIGVVATDAKLDKSQARRLAQVSHDGLARCIYPVHTAFDGDTMFALATGVTGDAQDLLLLASLATEVTARATLNAVRAARGLQLDDQWWPSATDLEPTRA